MDSKRPDVRVDDTPEEEGRVTNRPDDDDDRRSVLERLRAYLKR